LRPIVTIARAPGLVKEPLDLLPGWWRAVERSEERNAKRKISLEARQSIRNNRRFSRKTSVSKTTTALWTMWWMRMEREAGMDRQTSCINRFLEGKELPTPKSSEMKKSTPSKRCLIDRRDIPAKRTNKFTTLLKFWGGGTENNDVISRQTKNSNLDQLADLRGDLGEMESDQPAV
jgi:hypothetical protein